MQIFRSLLRQIWHCDGRCHVPGDHVVKLSITLLDQLPEAVEVLLACAEVMLNISVDHLINVARDRILCLMPGAESLRYDSIVLASDCFRLHTLGHLSQSLILRTFDRLWESNLLVGSPLQGFLQLFAKSLGKVGSA